MKGFLSVLVIVLLIGAGWWFYQSGTNTPVIPDAASDEMMDEGSMMDDGMVQSGMPTMENGTVMEKEVIQMMDGGMMAAEKTFDITGKSFEFSRKEIRVKRGDKVTINFESTGGLHDLTIDEFKAHTQQVQPGTKTSTTFVADKTGTFEYYCSVGEHRARGMVGKLIVE